MNCEDNMLSSVKMASRTLLAVAMSTAPAFLGSDAEAQSAARQWNETLLDSIRKDTPRPPVHARNLFHVSVAMYDAWAAFDANAQGYFFHEKISAADPAAAQVEAVSYAAYRVMRQRFAGSPNAQLIRGYLDARMMVLGYSIDVTTTEGNSPAAVGNRVAAQLLASQLEDGSRESFNYAPPPGTPGPVNPPLVVGLPGSNIVDPNRWQPLALSFTYGPKGNVIPGSVQSRLAPHWGGVSTFGLTAADRDMSRGGVYLDAPAPAQLHGATDAAYRSGHEDVLMKSSTLTPDDGAFLDISPAVLGNNPLGTNDGNGRRINPATGQPYASNVVKRGDYTRCLAEFWADGPTSATPPGHWNEIANAVMDHPLFQRRIAGTGPELAELEYDVKLYVALNGAMHDAAVTAWGYKTFYDSTRPISAIRYMAQCGQRTDPSAPSYHPDGLDLMAGSCELITAATTAPGQRHAALAGHEGEVAVLAWPGVPADAANSYSGVKWVLGTEWKPYQRGNFVTPAFAGYMSGHSTFSRTAAEVLARMTGSEYFPGGMATFTCNQNQFLVFEDGPSQTFTFQWATYYDASDTSGESRLYGGIHPDFDDFPARRIGAQLGAKGFNRALALFNPPACPADLNGDSSVGAPDLAVLLGAFGSSDAAADLNGDGSVNAADLSVLLGAWGGCP
ncbi:MAG: hypothetical protein RL325_862 [Planctomycetota bacterium]|jgi:hypothetical protein